MRLGGNSLWFLGVRIDLGFPKSEVSLNLRNPKAGSQGLIPIGINVRSQYKVDCSFRIKDSKTLLLFSGITVDK